MFRATLFLLLLSLVTDAREFDPRRDAFAFSNDTALDYSVDDRGRLVVKKRSIPAHLAHRCFLFTRAAIQFWNFAKFEPRQGRLAEADYRARLRALFRIPVWDPPREQRIIFPGYANLWEFSKAHAGLVQSELGSWVLTYLRVGNWRMVSPFIRLLQHGYAERLFADVSAGRIRAMYLAKFPSMNHVVLVYSADRLADGRMRFRVYDANYAGQTARLEYNPKRNLFEFERRFYWPGGELRAFPVYTSPIH